MKQMEKFNKVNFPNLKTLFTKTHLNTLYFRLLSLLYTSFKNRQHTITMIAKLVSTFILKPE